MISLRQPRHHQNQTVLQVEALESRYLLNAPAPGTQLVPAPTQQRAPAKMTLMLAALALLFGGVGQVKAEFIVTFSQVGANVEAEGSGTLDLSALSLVSPASTSSPRMYPSQGLLEIGSSDPSFIVVGYSGVGATAYPGGILNSDPTSFGPGSGANDTPSTSTGSDVGIDGQAGYLYVPQAYASGSSLSSNATWDNTTISGLGLTPGTYTWTWGSAAAGTADSFVVEIPSATTATPEPSTLTLLGIGALCSLGYGWRRRKQSA